MRVYVLEEPASPIKSNVSLQSIQIVHKHPHTKAHTHRGGRHEHDGPERVDRHLPWSSACISHQSLHITSVQWGVVWRGEIVEEGGLVVGVDVGPLSTLEEELHFQ